jgi:hypothetical protein
MGVADLGLDMPSLAELCRRYGVAKLEAFGDAGPGSDLDLLVTYLPSRRAGLDFVAMHRDLEALLGCRVDVLTRASVENCPNKYFRRFALRDTEVIYEQT